MMDKLERIASNVLSLDTLETRSMDNLDFKDQAVWNIKKSLEQAFHAGYNEGYGDAVVIEAKCRND
jgi:hypothetical protein